jgi:CheY-like chemotaxis protein
MTQKILVVDDEPQALKMLDCFLNRTGYLVIGASSGAEALQKIQLEKPDLVILDIMMPEMDGHQVYR